MSLPVVAIVVASVSALFTGVNVAASLATYRRGRPRVYVLAYWNPYIRPCWGPDADPGIFTIRFINRSQAAVKVGQLYAEFDHGNGRFPKRTTAMCSLKIIKGEKEDEIPPFGGIHWIAQTPRDISRVLPDIYRARLNAVLTNGSRVRSKWFIKPLARAELEGTPSERSGQLSFDDLEEVEQS